MQILKLLSVMAFSLGPALTYAATVAAPSSYDCRAAIFAKDLPNGYAEFKYSAVARGGSHGGQSYSFNVQDYKIAVLSDSRWMGITWEKGGVIIASTVTARADENQNSQALIVYNPQDLNEEATLNCSAHGQD